MSNITMWDVKLGNSYAIEFFFKFGRKMEGTKKKRNTIK